jgi:LacI family transcriptional regulator
VAQMTMRQLASLAGLDISTVSRAVRGDTTRVAPATIANVQALAARYGYRPDPMASSLRSGRSRVIGVLVPTLADVGVGAMVDAIATAADERGYLPTVTPTDGVKTRRAEAVATYLGRRVDGVILADAGSRNPVPAGLEESGVPFLMALKPAGAHPAVVADDELGGRLAAEHLLALGHRDIAVIAGPRNTVVSSRRLTGFRKTLARAGVSLAPDRVRHGNLSLAAGRSAMTSILDTGPRPTAVFAVDDHSAVGAVRSLLNHRIAVGHDVAVVGYNDIPIGAELQVPLTTVHNELDDIGRRAVEAIVTGIEGGPVTSQVVAPRLIVRESSCPPPRRRRS